MTLILIAALSRNGVIGSDGWMPWHLPEDLRRFKSLTMGRPMIMGRRTFEAIGRALPGRRSIVVTRNPDWSAPGVERAASMPAALELAGDGDIFVTGGGEIYAAALPLADRLELTHVDVDVPGDTYFPTVAAADWERTATEQHDGFVFASYRRRPAPAAAITDLTELLAGLEPELHNGDYVFCVVLDGLLPDGLEPVATVSEPEGLSVVIPAGQAEQAGLDRSAPMSWITLRVQSSLTAVGLTGAVAAALARDGISCNMIAGFHHDHVFVPASRADDAMACLRALQSTGN